MAMPDVQEHTSQGDASMSTRDTARDTLLKLWYMDFSVQMEDVRVVISDRTTQEKTKVVNGDQIGHLGRSFMDMEGGGRIPFYKVLRVEHVNGHVYFERRNKPVDL